MPTLTMVQAIRDAQRVAMKQDDRVVVLGEDVARRGGVFLATEGLLAEFGAERVIDTPLSESGILGSAIGMALNGLIPIAEVQFIDFLWPGFDQVVSEAAKLRYRSGGQFSVPLVIRAPYGGGIRGGHYHSQSPETYYVHTPGLKVVVPATPADAKGLLLSAIRDPDPVIFMEPKKIYRATKEDVPADDYSVPLGVARVAQEGSDATVIAFGAMLHVALEAARKLAAEGASVEVLDLRTLLPFDREAILTSVKKTGRAVALVEAPALCSYASEMAAFLQEEALDSLLAPVRRVTGYFTPVPYGLDRLYLPDADRVVEAVRGVLQYG